MPAARARQPAGAARAPQPRLLGIGTREPTRTLDTWTASSKRLPASIIIFCQENHYTYRLALKRAVQANGRTDAHDGRFPWAFRLDRASLDMPVMRVACFVL